VTEGLALDVYDLSKLPAVSLMGSVTAPANAQELSQVVGGLQWINEVTPAVLTQGQTWNWYPYAVMIRPAVALSSKMGLSSLPFIPRRFYQPDPAFIRAFDVSKPDAPTALKPVKLDAVTDTLVSVSAAGDGLFAYAYGEKPSVYRIAGFTKDGEEPVTAAHRLGVVDFANPLNPVLRAPIQVPGRVFGVTDLSRTGFLTYTETLSAASQGTKPTREVQVSVVDEFQAILVAKTPVAADAVLAADGRSLYVAGAGVARRLSVDDSAAFVEVASTSLDWMPSELQSRGLTLLGVNGNQLMRVSWNGPKPALETWKMRQWFGLSKMTIGVDRTIYAPMGDFGVERFEAR
jgi:hypothetical protein